MAQDKENKSPNVPPLRFPEFSGNWEIMKIGELLDFYSTNSLSWDQLNYEGGFLRNLHYGLIHKGMSTLIDTDKIDLPFITTGYEPKKYTKCLTGDVAFADASEDTNDVGKAVEFIISTDDQNIICGLHTLHGRDKVGKTAPGFKGYAFRSASFRNQIRRLAQGTKVFSISTKVFDEIYIGVPSIAEQAKISRLLQLLDERIATQNKIIEKLQSLIKGLASSLTSQGVPNTEITNCLACNSSSLQEGEIEKEGLFPVYGASGIAGYTNDAMITGKAILIIKDGSGVGTVSLTQGKCSVLATLNYLTSKGNFLLSYIYYALMSFNFEPYKTGMAIPHIYFKDYGRAKIWCPERKKQMEISNLLFSIEEKIRLESRLLCTLQHQKSFLLHKIFI